MKLPIAIATILASTLVLNCHGMTAYRFLDVAGKVTRNHASCVTVAATGLTWELKTDDGGIHDKDNRYRWGGIGAEQTGKGFYDDWNSLLATTNNEKLCGFDDWRVPTIDELKTLVISTGITPMIDTAVFPLTLAEPYWSVSTYQQYPEHAQTVDFGTGLSHYYNGFRGNSLPVRLVRTGKAVP
ncbi:MAG TPA: DUF1566 domain-containing protein [Cellvibrio sp.]